MSAATVHGPEWFSEKILRLRVGEHAPKGYEIKRILGVVQQPVGVGTNYVEVYVVSCREILA